MISVLGVLALAAAQFVTGFAFLLLARSSTFSDLNRLIWMPVALLAGMAAHTFVVLFALLAGLPLSGWYSVGLTVAAVGSIAFNRERMRQLLTAPRARVSLLDPVAGLLVGIGVLALVVWFVPAMLALPTIDYDGLVIWSYRVKILMAERMLFVDALIDPERLIAQPRHPYFITAMEAGYCVAGGKFSHAAIHAPHMLLYGCYLALSAGMLSAFTQIRHRLIIAASLLLLPAIPVELLLVSAREPIVAIFALASTAMLILWTQAKSFSLLALSAFFAVVVQQSKIDGLPFLAGWIAGAVFLLISGMRSAARPAHVIILIAIFALALPWMIIKNRIPASPFDPPFMSSYSLLLTAKPEFIPRTAALIGGELFLRPELYGFAPHAALIGLLAGWRRSNMRLRLGVLAAPLAALCAVIIVYVLRQSDLPPERNASITRHVIGFLPALILAAWYRPGEQSSKRPSEPPPAT